MRPEKTHTEWPIKSLLYLFGQGYFNKGTKTVCWRGETDTRAGKYPITIIYGITLRLFT